MSVVADQSTAADRALAPVAAIPLRPRPGRAGPLSRLWPEVRPYRTTLLWCVVLGLVADSTGLVTPLAISWAIDGPIARGELSALWAPALIVLVLGVLDAVASWIKRRLAGRVEYQFEITMRARLFQHMQALQVGVHDSWDSGQLLARTISDLSMMRRFVAIFGPWLVITIGSVLAGMTALFVVSWEFGLAQLIISIPLVYVSVRFERGYEVAAARAQDQQGDITTTAEEAAQGIRVLKAFGRGPQLHKVFVRQTSALRATELVKVRLLARLWASLQGLPPLAVAAMLVIGALGISRDTMTLGTLVAGVTLARFLRWPTATIGYLLAELHNARAAARRYWEVMDTPIDITDPDPALAAPAIRGEIDFREVHFTFSGADAEILRGVSLRVYPGETVAIVGATGSGKSALLNLIPRLYDVSAGSITIDGADVSQLRLAELRSRISVAFEEPVLFSASVRENVTLGAPGADEEQLWWALEVAQAAGFVRELAWGLETRIGEQGHNLSGGQRQRLALARAVLHAKLSKTIVVLDDPLSALDVATEERVQARLRAELASTTVLLVAHRPSTAALADRVAVLDGGCIIATGTHERLLASCSRYRELMGGTADEF